MCFGQFTEGMSKKHILTNPKTGFLIMSLDKNIWRGKATYTHPAKEARNTTTTTMCPCSATTPTSASTRSITLDLVSQTGKSPCR